jgi:hypothetical protein
MGTYDTFIIKISNGSLVQPRGSIQHLASQEMKQFEGFAAMNDFVSRHLKIPERPNELRDQNTNKPFECV